MAIAAQAGCAHLFGVTPKQKEEAEIHNDLGATAFQNHRYQEAMQEFQTAIQYNPDFALPHAGLGDVFMYYWTGPKMDDAKREFQKAVQIDPHFAEAWNNLGTIYASQGDLSRAQAAFEKALGEPFYKTPWIAQTNLGWVIHLEGHTEQGKMLIRQALVAAPRYCMGHRELARILGDEGKVEAADAEWEEFARHCPTDPLAAFHEGTILLRRGDAQGASNWFNACTTNAGSDPIARDCQASMVGLPPPQVAPPQRQVETIDAPATAASDTTPAATSMPSASGGTSAAPAATGTTGATDPGDSN